MTRRGHHGAFEALVNRYESRLLSFCRHMLGSTEDAEDVLQEVFAASFNAMCADDRPINARPWLYRIARNRCLNHLRRPVHSGQDSMDVFERDGGISTADTVHKREEFRHVVADVQDLPETQRTALLLREMDALSYDQISEAMDTTVPSVKSLLVRARVSLAEAAEARLLTCEEVRLELGEVAEGLAKSSAPARRHLKGCDRCRVFKAELRKTNRALAAVYPIGPLIIFKKFLGAKLGIGAFGSTGSAAGGGAAVGSGAAVGGGAGVAGGAAGLAPVAAGGVTAIGGAGGASAAGAIAATGGSAGGSGLISAGVGALASKAAAGVVAAAIVTAGAVEVKTATIGESAGPKAPVTAPATPPKNPAPPAISPLSGDPTAPAVEETLSSKPLDPKAADSATTAAADAPSTPSSSGSDASNPAASPPKTPHKTVASEQQPSVPAVKPGVAVEHPSVAAPTLPHGQQTGGSTVVLPPNAASSDDTPLTAPHQTGGPAGSTSGSVSPTPGGDANGSSPSGATSTSTP